MPTAPHHTSYDLGPIARIPLGEGRTFIVEKEVIAIFRPAAREVFATEAACPHACGPLAGGLEDDRSVLCPNDDHRFDLATGKPRCAGSGYLRTFHVEVGAEGHMFITLDHAHAAE